MLDGVASVNIFNSLLDSPCMVELKFTEIYGRKIAIFASEIWSVHYFQFDLVLNIVLSTNITRY